VLPLHPFVLQVLVVTLSHDPARHCFWYSPLESQPLPAQRSSAADEATQVPAVLHVWHLGQSEAPQHARGAGQERSHSRWELQVRVVVLPQTAGHWLVAFGQQGWLLPPQLTHSLPRGKVPVPHVWRQEVELAQPNMHVVWPFVHWFCWQEGVVRTPFAHEGPPQGLVAFWHEPLRQS
jgi:hypothetical protein